MKILMMCVLVFSISLVLVVILIAYKIIKKKSVPENIYTPFDYITSQVPSEFHEEKEEEKEENDEIGDDKDKNIHKY